MLSAKPPLSLGKLTNPALTLKRARVQMEISAGSSIPGEVRVLPTRQLTVVISKKDSASLGTNASLSTLKKLECASFSLSAALVQKERGVILNTCSWEEEVAPPDHPEEINHQATTRRQNPRMSTIVLQPLADHRRTFQRRVRKLLATKVTMGKTAAIRGAVQGCSTTDSERLEWKGAPGHAKVVIVSSGEAEKGHKFAMEVRKGDIVGIMNSGASEHIFKDWRFASDLKDSSAVIETASKDGKVSRVRQGKIFATLRGDE